MQALTVKDYNMAGRIARELFIMAGYMVAIMGRRRLLED
jgi:hypothetical protein